LLNAKLVVNTVTGRFQRLRSEQQMVSPSFLHKDGRRMKTQLAP